MPSIFKYLSLFASLGMTQIIPFDQPLPILTSPVVQVQAGKELHYQLTNFRNSTCQATLSFQNDTFLPVSAFASPRNCAGDQVAKLRIPESVPNGAAALEWQCSGTDGTAVNLMVISGGDGDWERFVAESEEVRINVQCWANVTGAISPPGNSSCV
ncbi:uncharacterized protein K460DRAFT_421111 [Cucurbitaria berberidis CBS 394.84]|uniref:Uncharacterized protein n=1 Tax=Cucurbitaria berberidis CBS 394.84 TaxID=1168544 RepID=A0A9P4G6T9_9PLEO|nr:uncharacterized protein K460DRAFT_421111 [Cucurbitaria berberidis CBS 394.84]KAF1840103.1 hypothetical protein K460DRAFT_421111 [Cucurbitaria berberidis CBS 394.84]